MQKKQHKNAELYLREMIRRQSLIKSPPPLEVGMLYYMLANATRNKNYYNKARPYLKKVLKQEQERTNPQKIEIASFTLMLGKIALETGRLEQAINDSEKAKDLLIQLKSGKLSMLTVYSQLADAYCRNDQPEKALKYIQYSRDISRQLYGEKSYSTACCISLHAVILYDLKKKKQAITLLEQAHDIFLETREKNDKATINAAKMLAKWKKNKN
jgi:pentatricopeptide repeat protein